MAHRNPLWPDGRLYLYLLPKLLMFCTAVAVTAQAAAAPVSPALLQPLQWRSIGPFRGGRVLAVTGVPGEPEHFYFGAVNGGVWETHDAGRSWAPIFDTAPVGSVGSLAVAPSNPRVLYVGTGEADMRSNIAQGAGLFRSADGGHSWQPAGLADSQQIGRIVVDPRDPDVLLVAALGHPYGGNPMRGVFRSTDGGRNWQRTLYRDADTGATDLALQPDNAAIVYAALWQTRRPPWNVYPPSSGPGGGLHKSVDGGRTWTALSGHGLPDAPGRIGLAVASSRPQRVFALVDAVDGGLYRSNDAGANWVRISNDSRIWKRGWYFGGVTVDPLNAEVVYVCNTAMYRSDDGGRTFVPVKGAPGGDDYHQLWIDPAAPQRQILGVDQGAIVTVDGGATWSSWFNQPTGQFYHVVTDHRFPYWVYGAQQDSGAAGIPSRTDGIDGINLTQFREMTAGGESDNVAPDPDDPQLIFGGRVDKLDLRSGQTQNVDPTLAYPDRYRGEWTLPLVFGTAGPHALYFGNQRVFRTIDRGAHWAVISPDLSRERPAIPPNLDAATIADDDHGDPRRGVVYALGPSPLDGRLLWAGTDDGLVWRTQDGGAHWQDVTPPGLTAWSKVGVVEPSHFDARTAYVAVDRHRLDDPRPYIYRTRDDGASWTPIVDGVADGGPIDSVNVVREDPRHRGLLYCGTERGVYVSFDDGDHWQPLQQNLPRTSVRDLEVHGDDLVIATHGRGFWIMDDVAPLRAFADAAGGGSRLLAPAIAYRFRPSAFTGSPMQHDEPRGANPPDGAYIDFVLEAGVASTLLTITDAAGTLVRTFHSTDAAAVPDIATLEVAPEWILPPQPPTTGAGTHRFVWDLHYTARPELVPADPSDVEKGVWAPPGRYWVELEVDGRRQRQPLTIAADPRLKLTADAYRRQFALARDIEASRAVVAAALAEAEKIHAAIATLRGSASGPLAASLAAADQRLIAISDLAVDKRSPDSTGADVTTVSGLRYLAAAFKSLARAADGADAAPGPDLLRGCAEQQRVLVRARSAWAAFRSQDLARLDIELAAAGIAPIGAP